MKMRLIQFLYDLNELCFDILDPKVNYELDTSWPTIINGSTNRKPEAEMSTSGFNLSLNGRHRTFSVSSLSSILSTENNVDLACNLDCLLSSSSIILFLFVQNHTEHLSGSTSLEMDDDILTKLSISFNPSEMAQQIDHLKLSEKEMIEQNFMLKSKMDALNTETSCLNNKVQELTSENLKLKKSLVHYEQLNAGSQDLERAMQHDNGNQQLNVTTMRIQTEQYIASFFNSHPATHVQPP
jgi:hypothetical protein